MGINAKDLALVVRLAEQGYVKRGGKIVEIGAQQLSNDFLRSTNLVRKAEAVFGAANSISLPQAGFVSPEPGPAEFLDSNAPFARDFWLTLGLDYTAIDIDGSPCSIPLDLNFDEVRREQRGQYDLVTNLGTTEHICNQINAFKAIHDLAAPGAVMIHHLPAGGALNHGLFNYNPKFFWCLARSNDYEWLYMDFYGGSAFYPLPENILATAKQYEPLASQIMLDRKTCDYAIQVALRKTLDIPFVPPLDVDSGTTSSHSALSTRYWTVFQPRTLDAIRRSGGARQLIASAGIAQAKKDDQALAPSELQDIANLSDEARATPKTSATEAASYETRFEIARAIAGSEETLRTAIERFVANSEESVRNALNRRLSDSEEVMGNTTNRVVSAHAEALRTAIAGLGEGLRRLPGRRFIAFVAAVSSLTTAVVIAAVLLASRLLHF